MKSLLSFFIVALLITSCHNREKPKPIARVDTSHETDSFIASPPPVTALCFKSKEVDKLMEHPYNISDSVFNKLTAREKFIFAFQYPESFFQICSFPRTDIKIEKKPVEQLNSQLSGRPDGARMSERQLKGLKVKRDSTILYMHLCIESIKNIPHEYEYAIKDLQAYELIPDILALGKGGVKGKDFYTLLLLLMKDGYPDFKKNALYDELYGGGKGYNQSVPLTQKRIDVILDLSNQFYRWKTANK